MNCEDNSSKRFYQILAINAPTTTENKVILPGDPTSLYAALVVLVDKSLRERAAAGGNPIPDFGTSPSLARRRQCEENRSVSPTPEVPDDCIFDPRVWNKEVEAELKHWATPSPLEWRSL